MICRKRGRINLMLIGGAHVKKLWCLFAVLILSFTLTGCGTDLTDAETRIIAEYAADLLLEYDINYEDRIVENTEEDSSTDTEAVSETEESDTESVDTEAPNTASTEEDTSQTSSVGPTAASDIAKIIGLEDISIVFQRCMFLDRYPSVDQNGAFIYMDAEPGYKLVVLKFNVANESAQDVTVDLLNTEIDYKLVLNDTKTARPMLTILLDDLGTFQNIVPANSEQSAVLIFQMSEGLIEQIETLKFQISYQNEEYIIHVQ